jgi:4'-phosphopantetheinyl transferase
MTELWLVDLEAAAPALEALEREVPRLSADDRARASRLSEPYERQNRLATYVALRVVLERAAGPSVRGQKLIRSDSGKPRLDGPGPAFSLSHAGGLALIAVTNSSAVGVDLEATRVLHMSRRRREETLAVAAGFASSPAGDAGSDATVLQAWCRLEAYAKATGEGISGVLGKLGLRRAQGRQRKLAEIESAARRLARGDGLAVADVRPGLDLYGAVAHASAARAPRLRRFPTDHRAIARLLAPIQA